MLLKECKLSSYNEYLNRSIIIDSDFILKMFSEEKDTTYKNLSISIMKK